jgi:phosphoribosyl-ATP pyrophosphohydrolase
MNVLETQGLPRAQQYEQMVRDLFTKELGGLPGQRMHAAIGIAGESIELFKGYMLGDEPNIVEEGGDAFFYFQALLNQTGWTIEELKALGTTMPHELHEQEGARTLIAAGDLLDVAKKTWVYEKELDAGKLKQAMANWIIAFIPLMEEEVGLDLEDLKAHNQYKLVTGPNARFATGKYTDQQAIARADKAPGE